MCVRVCVSVCVYPGCTQFLPSHARAKLDLLFVQRLLIYKLLEHCVLAISWVFPVVCTGCI